jgi:hypothetical protein
VRRAAPPFQARYFPPLYVAVKKCSWLQNAIPFQLQAVKIEGGHRPPSLLHSKGFKRDGFLEHRARQVLRFDIPNEVPGH